MDKFINKIEEEYQEIIGNLINEMREAKDKDTIISVSYRITVIEEIKDYLSKIEIDKDIINVLYNTSDVLLLTYEKWQDRDCVFSSEIQDLVNDCITDIEISL